MNNLFKADLLRIFRRVSRWICIGIFYVITILVLFPWDKDAITTSVTMRDNIKTVLEFGVFYVGLIEIFFILGDDFKAKSIQVAIGLGVKRKLFLNTKYMEFVVVCLFDLLSTLVVGLIFSLCLGYMLDAKQVLSVIIVMFCSLLSIVCYLSICMPLMFFTQSIGFGTILYIALSFEGVNQIVGIIAGFDKIAKYHIQTYSLTEMLHVNCSRLLLGTVSIKAIIGIVIYLFVSFQIAKILFKRKELEF